MLAYNCSPSFNWKRNLDDATIAKFQRELGAMGYKFQFITLAGFHSLNYSMFELAYGYARDNMTAFVELQEKEFAAAEKGFTAVKHQREVGTGYFDQITQVVHRRQGLDHGAARLDRGRAVLRRGRARPGEEGEEGGLAGCDGGALLRALDHDALLPRLEARLDAHAALGDLEVVRQELDQRFVRLAVDRPRREPHLDALAVLSGKLGARGARLNVKMQNQAVAIARTAPSSSISRTQRIRSRTSGVRSTRPTGGMKRRSGRRNGRVTALNTGIAGASGFTQENSAWMNTAKIRM